MNSLKKIYEDIDSHLLNEQKPSIYLNYIYNEPLFSQYPFDMLMKLIKTDQSPQHHPEGDVWEHTMLVIDEAAKAKNQSKNKAAFMWAALLHDIGKPDTQHIRNNKITFYNHEKIGANHAINFLQPFTNDVQFINSVAFLVRWHMQVLYVIKDLPFADNKMMKQQGDIREIALLGYCDRLGRLYADREIEYKNIEIFISKCDK